MFLRRYVLMGFSAFVIFETFLYLNKGTPERLKKRVLQSKNDLKEGFPVFCLIICQPHAEEFEKLESKEGILSNNAERQLNQTFTLLKSVVTLTRSPFINFIILVDEYWIFFELLNKVKEWPKDFRKKLILQRRGIFYSPERKELRAQFRVCATERLFLTELLPDVDALIYLDTDLIFMRPPEELWDQFKLFDSRHVSGISPYFYHENAVVKLPHYGNSGLNVGMWMMNLTRMRNFPGEDSWSNECFQTFHSYKKELYRVTQDVVNIIFHKYSELLYEMGCEWNFRKRLCSIGSKFCNNANDHGVHLMHGAGLSFISDREMKFAKFYEAWNEYEVGSPLTELLGLIRRRLAEVEENNLESKCKEIDNIDQLITKGLENHIRSL